MLKTVFGKHFCALLRKSYVTKVVDRPVQWKLHILTDLAHPLL